MTEQELNEAVARNLGWVKGSDPGTIQVFEDSWAKGDPIDGEGYSGGIISRLPDYCHSIEAAWEIVERQKETGYFRMYLDREFMGHGQRLGYVCVFGAPNSTKFIEEWAPTAPMAICLAFLKLNDAKLG